MTRAYLIDDLTVHGRAYFLSPGVVVRHLDFGNNEQIPHQDAQPLRAIYTSLPVQGIPCRVDQLQNALPNGLGERLLVEGKP